MWREGERVCRGLLGLEVPGRRPAEEIYGCSGRVEEESCSGSRGCRAQGEMEADDWLQPLLKGREEVEDVFC